MMISDDLYKYGKILFGNRFLGVFPLDGLPRSLTIPSYFILNTDTGNLPGKHWLAVAYTRRGEINAFDSYGWWYPQALVSYLKKYGRLILNSERLQKPYETNCGIYAMRWLIQKKNEA